VNERHQLIVYRQLCSPLNGTKRKKEKKYLNETLTNCTRGKRFHKYLQKALSHDRYRASNRLQRLAKITLITPVFLKQKILAIVIVYFS